MLFEIYDIGIEPRVLNVILGLALGLLFGVFAQVSRFCLRRALDGDTAERKPAAGVWMAALGVAVLAVAGLGAAGLVDLTGHRWLSPDLPLLAIVLGGLAFGAGMVLTRGCMSRLTVLGASGNLRALTVIVIFAIVAHAMMKGVLSPLREALGAVTLASPIATLGELPGGPLFWALALALPLIGFALRSGAGWGNLGLGAGIGLIAAAAWSATSVLFLDAFDPQPAQSLAFTLPWTETLFWIIASSAVPANFGLGLMAGVIAGACASALLRKEARLEGFDHPGQMLRYGAGGVLMAVGGVLAGGCTLGAGLAGGATLSVAALLALGSIIAGARIAVILLSGPAKAGAAATA